jgi:hypothetical protein
VFFPVGEKNVMVGRVTLLMPVIVLSAIKSFGPDVSENSGPFTG